MKKEEKKPFIAEKDAASASDCIKREAVCLIRENLTVAAESSDRIRSGLT